MGTYVDYGVFEDGGAVCCEDCALARADGSVGVFEVPAASFLVEVQLGCVVAFVEIFEDGGEDFWCFVGEFDSFAVGFEELRTACFGEVW